MTIGQTVSRQMSYAYRLSPQSVVGLVVCALLALGAEMAMRPDGYGNSSTQLETAEPTRPVSQIGPQARPQATPLEPALLLRSLEASLAPYSRMKGRWTVQRETSKPEEREQSEWVVCRDPERLRVLETKDTASGHEIFECRMRHGKETISFFADGKIVCYPQPSRESELDLLGSSICAPCYGVISGTWIPDFLHTAKLSVEADTLDGRSVYRLRGLTMDTKMELWLDPSLDYAARRIRFDKRASEIDLTVRSRQLDATQFRLERGHHVVTEATLTSSSGPQPIFSPEAVEKIVNGKRIKSFEPARDEKGSIIMMARRQSVWKIKLRDIEFDPQWSDRDFQFEKPIANGTKVEMSGAGNSHYVWKDGNIVRIAPDGAPK
jgi:hypothetical protein